MDVSNHSGLTAARISMAESTIDPEPPQPSDPTEPPEKANYNEMLLEAASDGDVEKVKSCLAKGADIETKNSRWKATPLYLAVNFDHEEVVEILLEKNANVDSKDCDGETPLYRAAAVGNETIVKMLLEHHADINAKDNDGRTPLYIAVFEDNNDIVGSYYAMVLNWELKTEMGILN